MWKAAIRLLAYLSLSTTTLTEFQRSVITPNITKLNTALLALAEKQMDESLLVLCLNTLTELVRAFPSSLRSMADSLSSICLKILDGSEKSTPWAIVTAASRLYTSLHVTGGKVGGSALWRKGVDETVAFVRRSLNELRTSYMDGAKAASSTDLVQMIALRLDRLLCGVELLCSFLRSVSVTSFTPSSMLTRCRSGVSRSVIIPVNPIVGLCVELLRVEESAQASRLFK